MESCTIWILAVWYLLCGLTFLVYSMLQYGFAGWLRATWTLPVIVLTWPYWLYTEVRYFVMRRRLERWPSVERWAAERRVFR